jgi:hypothetical protein
MQTESVARIMNALESVMAVTSINRRAVKASLWLVSNGNDMVADGFNDNIARNARRFPCRRADAPFALHHR